MTVHTPVPASVKKKVQNLHKLAQALHHGKNFSITKLTTIKSLCKIPEDAFHFVFCLARLTQKKIASKKPNHISSKRWMQHRELVAEAIVQMEKYLTVQGLKENKKLGSVCHRFKEFQNNYENQRWGPVRIIESSKTLLVEKAMECMLSPDQSDFWSYHVAREYAERYDSAYGTGLIPESAPMVRDIVNFWSQRLGVQVHSTNLSSQTL